MTHKHFRRTMVTGAAGIVAAVCLGATLLIAQPPVTAQTEGAGIAVGTYDPMTVFSSSGLNEQLMQQRDEIQRQMQEAQQEGNQQAMQQLQLMFEQQQSRVLEEFQSRVNQALPTVAEQHGVAVVAVEISYTAPGVEVKDVTSDLAENLGDGALELDTPEPVQPF